MFMAKDEDPNDYNYKGSAPNITFRGNEWSKSELPSDPEIVSATFAAILD